ncbi:MAG: class I tRNA ligase family protein [Victivallales bacterium]
MKSAGSPEPTTPASRPKAAVEKYLREKEGTGRDELGREEFVKRVWTWREQYGGTIIRQLRKLGTSCDWERERFTMDEGLSDAVKQVFVDCTTRDISNAASA